MSGGIRPIKELVEELEGAGYLPIAVIGARKHNGYIVPKDCKLAWGMEGLWDAELDMHYIVKVPRKRRIHVGVR